MTRTHHSRRLRTVEPHTLAAVVGGTIIVDLQLTGLFANIGKPIDPVAANSITNLK